MELINYNGMSLRKNVVSDIQVFRSVYENDEYRTKLYDGRRGRELVIDVGAHVGSFARLWHEKNPDAVIVCVELNPKNIPLLKMNVGHFAKVIDVPLCYGFGRINGCHYLDSIKTDDGKTSQETSVSMVISEDEAKDFLAKYPSGISDLFELRKPVGFCTIETIMQMMGFDTVGVLKLDCEGAEFDILRNTRSLGSIRTIFGEWHNHREWYQLISSKRFYSFNYGEMDRCDVETLDVHTGGIFHLENTDLGKDIPPDLDFQKSSNPLYNTKRDSRKKLRIVVPQGIGDILWAASKIPALLRKEGARCCDLVIAGVDEFGDNLQSRAVEFAREFDFVECVGCTPFSIVDTPDLLSSGRWNCAPSQPGWHNFDWLLQANTHLEDGHRLEDWMPDFPIDWEIMKRRKVDLKDENHASNFAALHGDYIVVYAGSSRSNSIDNHNRGERWTPKDWSDLIKEIHETSKRNGRQIKFIAVGASYDAGYWRTKVSPAIRVGDTVDIIGATSIGLLIEIIKKSKGVIAFQSGIGCISGMLDIPTLMWWRAAGDSIAPDRYVSYDEKENGAFVKKEMIESGRYIPAIYRNPESKENFVWTPEYLAKLVCKNWLSCEN